MAVATPAAPVTPEPSPRPPAPKQPGSIRHKVPTGRLVRQPSLPAAPQVPRAFSLRPPPKAVVPQPSLATGPIAVATPTPSVEESEGPVEVEVVPPPDYQRPLPPDPQAVLQTPQAVHFGYTYSRSLLNLQRDGQLDVGIMNVGWTTVDVWLRNKSRQPLRMFLFPGMIFKPAGNTRWTPLMLRDLQEVFLYPGTHQVFRLQCYSLDRKKPLPDDQTPIPYALEPQRDPRFPRALRVMQAQLEKEAQPDTSSVIDGRTRTLTVQYALYEATSGRYDVKAQLSRELGAISGEEFVQISQAVLGGADQLLRAADRL